MTDTKREKALVALLSCSSYDEAARQCGLSLRSLYTLRTDPAFAEELNMRRRRMVETACVALQSRLGAASEAIAAMLDDEELPAKVRLDAAKTVLEYGLRTLETLDILPRLEALETAEAQRNARSGGHNAN